MAVVAISIGEMEVRAIVMIPAATAMAAGAAVKWASDRFGPVAWVVLGVLIGGGSSGIASSHPNAEREIGSSR